MSERLLVGVVECNVCIEAYSLRLCLTPCSDFSMSWRLRRGLMARASWGGYSGFSRWMTSFPLGTMMEGDLCLSAILGLSAVDFQEAGLGSCSDSGEL
jgi:hypothetical protein